MRLLAVVRLSDLSDASTSTERQRSKIDTYASLHDNEVVGLTEDLDVPGTESRPCSRPELILGLETLCGACARPGCPKPSVYEEEDSASKPL